VIARAFGTTTGASQPVLGAAKPSPGNPQIARVVSPDILVSDATDSQAWNRYSYVSNTPLNATDPSGWEEEGRVYYLVADTTPPPGSHSNGGSGGGGGGSGSGSGSGSSSGGSGSSGSFGDSASVYWFLVNNPQATICINSVCNSAGGTSGWTPNYNGRLSEFLSSDPVNFMPTGNANLPASPMPPPTLNQGGMDLGSMWRDRVAYAFVGAAPRLTEVGAIATAPVWAILATSAAILVGTTTSTAGPDEDNGNPEQYVVRAGAAAANSLQAGTAHTSNGYGFSVQTAPGLSPDQLAAGAPRIEAYRQYSVTTVSQLQRIPGVTVNATPGGGANHGTVNIPYPAPSGIFITISSQFQQRPNPFYKPN
jgi:hypothetical protein